MALKRHFYKISVRRRKTNCSTDYLNKEGMSLMIQRMLCKHQWQKENDITLVCTKCGKVRQIPCCHKWKLYQRLQTKEQRNWYLFTTYRDTLVCEKCGMIKQINL